MNAAHARKKLQQREARRASAPTPLVIVKPRNLGASVARASFAAVERTVLRQYTRTSKPYDATLPANRAAAIRKLLRAKDETMRKHGITAARSKHGLLQIKQRGQWVNFDPTA